MGVTDGQIEAVVQRIKDAAGGFGELVECFEPIPTVSEPQRRIFAQFADRTQIDLDVVDATNATVPGSVVLYDPAGAVATELSAAMTEPVWVWAACRRPPVRDHEPARRHEAAAVPTRRGGDRGGYRPRRPAGGGDPACGPTRRAARASRSGRLPVPPAFAAFVTNDLQLLRPSN
ncbi:MAG: hypothetical protein ACRD0L_10560 [Acidimicrobiales bacterium]